MTASLVNVDIDAPKFKYKSLAPFLAGITRDTWICKRDIDSAFLRLAVRPEDYRLYCFYHKGAYRCFARLPFGAASAPFLFLSRGRRGTRRVHQAVVGRLRVRD
mmetsp:Transcript_39553/g.97890  ORF Transcript_39553/g.97890 Transcript_39553/m.97890 type:complete len:104 (+) Transcript_39553:450-761(+)